MVQHGRQAASSRDNSAAKGGLASDASFSISTAASTASCFSNVIMRTIESSVPTVMKPSPRMNTWEHNPRWTQTLLFTAHVAKSQMTTSPNAPAT